MKIMNEIKFYISWSSIIIWLIGIGFFSFVLFSVYQEGKTKQENTCNGYNQCINSGEKEEWECRALFDHYNDEYCE